jgi:hypothetical protein
MLGLLGTFLGMVDTLNGAVTALQGTTELQAIRAGLAAPIQGLGLAFGTSVAGVASSAMLGLMSTLSRRERIIATQNLDTQIASAFRVFSLAHTKQQTYSALQVQATALPDVADKLNTLADKLVTMSENIEQTLTAQQKTFHDSVSANYSELAHSIDKSLKETLAESGKLAGENIKPIIQTMMEEIKTETGNTHQTLTNTVQEQLSELSSSWHQQQLEHDKAKLQQWSEAFEQINQTSNQQLSNTGKQLMSELQQVTALQNDSVKSIVSEFAKSTDGLNEQWQQANQQTREQQQAVTSSLTNSTEQISEQLTHNTQQSMAAINTLVSRTEELVKTRLETEQNWLGNYEQRANQINDTLQTSLSQLRDEEQQRGQAALERLGQLEGKLTEHLTTLGKGLEEPMTKLIETASETPKAAAEVIEQLRGEIAKNVARENSLLEERGGIMTELDKLSASLAQTATDQRDSINSLINASEQMLQAASNKFDQKIDQEMGKINQANNQFSGNSIEMASLGEAFAQAVHKFDESNTGLIQNLHRIETSLEQANNRNDEQLAYYVAQARDIIDHSIVSQKTMFDELRQLGESPRITEAESA